MKRDSIPIGNLFYHCLPFANFNFERLSTRNDEPVAQFLSSFFVKIPLSKRCTNSPSKSTFDFGNTVFIDFRTFTKVKSSLTASSR